MSRPVAIGEKASQAADGRSFANVQAPDAEVVALSISESGPGRVDAFAVLKGRFAFLEGYYAEDQRKSEAMMNVLITLPTAAGKKVGSIAVPSGKLACLPAPSRGAAFADAKLTGLSTAVHLDDEEGLLIAMPAGTYDVFLEPASKGSWGEATFAVLVPQ